MPIEAAAAADFVRDVTFAAEAFDASVATAETTANQQFEAAAGAHADALDGAAAIWNAAESRAAGLLDDALAVAAERSEEASEGEASDDCDTDVAEARSVYEGEVDAAIAEYDADLLKVAADWAATHAQELADYARRILEVRAVPGRDGHGAVRRRFLH